MGKKFGLGRGLESLIPEQDTNSEEQLQGKTKLININDIKPNNQQPRKHFDEAKIMELSESIKQHGIIQPLVLNKEEDNYVIIAGERRWRAAKKAGIMEVPAVIMNLTESEVLEISLIENIQRQDLNPIEEALAFKKLIQDFKLTQEELSSKIGRSRTAITNTMRLLNLDKRVQDYVIDGVISEGHGRTLLSIEDGDIQYSLAQQVIDEKLSVRQLEALIKNLDKKKSKPSDKKVNPYYNDVKLRLQNYFGTKVNINAKKNKGKIEIEYYSEDDLQRIIDMLEI
ncbi:ParB/RepB/Spo0J family partition protein [Clostridium polynesiense]|uniref:ParB/RepB/Spo0J family partition protein n=1 Tax=Clostridium polynesiense TaxID=1325933 RepID=UPI00058AD93D|nr:ParB/RepB/Spo0J family partition protein [Clostridium polynesiense]